MNEGRSQITTEGKRVDPSMVPASERFVTFTGSLIKNAQRHPGKNVVVLVPRSLSATELENTKRIMAAANIQVEENGGASWFLSFPP